MNSFRFLHIDLLHLLWLLPLLLALVIWSWQRRRRLLDRFVARRMLSALPQRLNTANLIWKNVFFLLACILIVVALARPVWNEKEITVKRTGRDVVFLLDVSRSMLAEDLLPNRLEHAKLAILDAIDRLQGDRVALVTFAGNAVVKCPLTLDYGFFRMMLEEVGTQSASYGGTMIGDAVRYVLSKVFDDQARQFKDIILITDGEDHESFPVEAAKAAGEEGIRMLIIGLGDEKEGQRIPVLDEQGRKTFLKFEGREVWTKLDAQTLRTMAKATPGGVYLPVATGTINLGDVYMDLVASAEKKELEAKTIRQYEEKFQIFLGAALVLLCLEMLLSERKKSAAGEGEETDVWA